MSIKRARLSPDESRLAALEAARALLIEAGPQAVTLKAVAGRIERTHANLLHHFGSAAGLQKALAAHLADTITTSIFHLNFKENNENDMAAHGIRFDFYYGPKPSKIGQNGSAAAADARLGFGTSGPAGGFTAGRRGVGFCRAESRPRRSGPTWRLPDRA